MHPRSPGAPGRDGAKVDVGSPGHVVLMERKEQRESLGSRVPPDIKGQRGDKGDSGTPRLALHMNWKECAWKKDDHKDSGVIYVSAERHFGTQVK